MSDQIEIEVVNINEFLIYFYWGRHPDDPMLDMRLGGGSFAIYRDGHAAVIDTMSRPGQGVWVKTYLEKNHGITQFTLIASHWHVDHIIDNIAYANTTIIGHQRTREIMLEKKAILEAGKYGSYDPFQVVPPNLTFEKRLDLWVGDIKLELDTYAIHEEGHIGIYLPQHKIFIANDLLEDPIWFFDFSFASAKEQAAELERMKQLGAERFFPCHGSVDVMKAGGYDERLIDANLAYLNRMMASKESTNFKDQPAQTYIREALDAGVLHWWEPYSEVHSSNQAAVASLSQ